MQRKPSPWLSWLAPGLVALSLICPAVRAQDDEAAGGRIQGPPPGRLHRHQPALRTGTLHRWQDRAALISDCKRDRSTSGQFTPRLTDGAMPRAGLL